MECKIRIAKGRKDKLMQDKSILHTNSVQMKMIPLIVGQFQNSMKKSYKYQVMVEHSKQLCNLYFTSILLNKKNIDKNT